MIGTKLGHYEITAKLGEGGMGVVYRATDTKLNRDVAIKVLPEALAGDRERMERFRREAQVLAQLNHSGIAGIYGVEEAESSLALVMELAEGDTLEQRLATGPLPLDDALPLARQIAEALEAAHEKGIIHRDLKPANIKVADDGSVKILDFGLAKALEGDATAPTSAPNDSPTLTMAATQAGLIIGTAAYMSPEQACARPADRRCDIWSYGVVLWEMLTGRKLFAAETVSHTLADVLRSEIDFTQLPATIPPVIHRLLRRCLERNPKRRLRDIGEARIAIEEQVADPTAASMSMDSSGTVPQPKRRIVLPWALATALFACAALVFGILHLTESPPLDPLTKTSLLPPRGTFFADFAVSPDGRKVAIVTDDAAGAGRLWVRSLDSRNAELLIEGAFRPFWSPDSRSIAFATPELQLQKIDSSGGPVLTICDFTTRYRGATWNHDGEIVFSAEGRLFRVPATGGQPVPFAIPNRSRGEEAYRWPVFLPDGRRFIFVVYSTDPEVAGLCVGELGSPDSTRILSTSFPARYSIGYDGEYLLFLRDRTLLAQRFDADGLRLLGEPIPVADRVALENFNTHAYFSVSEDGVLIHSPFTPYGEDELLWFSRTGERLGRVGDQVTYHPFRLSPDGQRLAYSFRDFDSRTIDLWQLDLSRGLTSRLTFDDADDMLPVWSPDGASLVFASNRGGVHDLYRKLASAGPGQHELLLKSDNPKTPRDWSRDGRHLLYSEFHPDTDYDLWVLPMTGERKPAPLLQTRFSERNGVFSPDAKWLAYVSNESGRGEVYVQPFPTTGAKWQISGSGVARNQDRLRWRHDGKELYYLDAERNLVAVPTRIGDSFEAGTPAILFNSGIQRPRTGFEVTDDGQRFLIPNRLDEIVDRPVMIIQNWMAEIENRQAQQ
jgi:eukaryotic-like serine/threonine-protein kinase